MRPAQEAGVEAEIECSKVLFGMDLEPVPRPWRECVHVERPSLPPGYWSEPAASLGRWHAHPNVDLDIVVRQRVQLEQQARNVGNAVALAVSGAHRGVVARSETGWSSSSLDRRPGTKGTNAHRTAALESASASAVARSSAACRVDVRPFDESSCANRSANRASSSDDSSPTCPTGFIEPLGNSGAVTAADLALEWWRAFGEGKLEALWQLSSRPVRYMLARAMVIDAVNTRAAGGDQAGVDRLLVACQGFALHGLKGPAWIQLEPLRGHFFDPINMDPLIKSMRLFPRTQLDVANYRQVTFFPPDTPPMPWVVDEARRTIVGFAVVLKGSDDAGELGERIAHDPIALWSAAP